MCKDGQHALGYMDHDFSVEHGSNNDANEGDRRYLVAHGGLSNAPSHEWREITGTYQD